MAIKISADELRTLERGRQPVLVVHDPETEKDYAVMPERLYDSARSVIDLVNPVTREADEEEWTEEKNARRAYLVNKKYDSRLTRAEERELNSLQEQVCRYQERVAPLNNRALELILEALQQRAKSAERHES